MNPGEVVVTKIRFAPHEENGLKKLYFESSELESGENVIYGNNKKRIITLFRMSLKMVIFKICKLI